MERILEKLCPRGWPSKWHLGSTLDKFSHETPNPEGQT